MNDIKELVNKMTRSEFLEWYKEGNGYCPGWFGLKPVEEENCNGIKCLDCIKEATKDIKFKDEIEEAMKVICIDKGDAKYLTNNKVYSVSQSKEYENYYDTVNDIGNIDSYRKERFKPIEPQKIKKNFREVIAEIKESEKWTDGKTFISMKNNKIKIECFNEDIPASYTYSETYREFTKIEPLKPVTTAEAFKVLEDGKIIKSIFTGYRYKKVKDKMMIETDATREEKRGFVKFTYFNVKELEGQWIIESEGK